MAHPGGRPSADRTGGLTAIYYLLCPETRVPRYVGKSINPAKRYQSHKWPPASDRRPSANWSRSLRGRGLAPVMEIVEWVDDWQSAERSHIAALRRDGADLLNIEEGGSSASHLHDASGRFESYIWATKFAGRTRRPFLLAVLRRAWALAKARGVEEMRRFDDMLRRDIEEMHPRPLRLD